MKNIFTYLVIFLFGVTVMFLIMQTCKDKNPVIQDRSEEVKRLMEDTTKYVQKIDSLSTVIDSLKSEVKKIPQQVSQTIQHIDQEISKDSTKALVQYRNMLQRWDYLPDGSDAVTYRELGLGAKIGQEGYGFKLQVKKYETEIVPKLEEQVKDYSSLYASSKNLMEIKDKSIEEKDIELAQERKWYHNDLLWFGGGAVIVTIIFSLIK